MAEMNRRTFMKLVGQGTAAVGIGIGFSKGLTGCTRTKMVEEDPKYPDWNNWEYYYPGKYDAEDTQVLNEFKAELDLINNRGDIDISDLVSGGLEGLPGIGRVTKITAEIMKTGADNYGAGNPLWLDPEYAKKTKWGEMLIPFSVGSQIGVPALPKEKGIGDYMVVSNYNVSSNHYIPVYEGDTLYSVTDRSDCVDITPEQGSYYRTFAVIGWGRTFNQKGELVHEGAGIRTESFRRRKDPTKRNPGGAHAWESPDWWKREAHQYTDKDWEEIIGIWNNENIRGATPLYWDDVNIGDQPAPRAVGPIITDVQTDILMSSRLSTDLKQNVLDPGTFANMVKNKQGIYVLPQYLEKRSPEGAPSTTAGGIPELSNRDGRCVLMNAVAAYWAGGMIMNWMGDDGWIQRIGWDIMELPPGTSKAIDFEKDPTIIPKVPMELRPALFDKYPYLEKVPPVKDKRANWHALEGDLIISRAYVTDKYIKDSEYFADLIWWCETLDKYIVEEGFCTVKLPKKA